MVLFSKCYFALDFVLLVLRLYPIQVVVSLAFQRRSKGTSSVAFKVLIINCQTYFINLFIFNCRALNIKLFIFKLFDVKFLFSENHVFRKQKRTAVYGVIDVRP